jgi:hypothetical protein
VKESSSRGKIIDRDGKAVLDFLNGVSIEILADSKATAQLEALRRDVRQPIVEVAGVSRMIPNGVEQLTVSSASVAQGR